MLFESTPYYIIAQRFRPGDALNVEMNGGEGENGRGLKERECRNKIGREMMGYCPSRLKS